MDRCVERYLRRGEESDAKDGIGEGLEGIRSRVGTVMESRDREREMLRRTIGMY